MISYLASFVYDKTVKMHKKSEEVTVHVEIISQGNDGNSKTIKYDGPASDINKIMDGADRILEK